MKKEVLKLLCKHFKDYPKEDGLGSFINIECKDFNQAKTVCVALNKLGLTWWCGGSLINFKKLEERIYGVYEEEDVYFISLDWEEIITGGNEIVCDDGAHTSNVEYYRENLKPIPYREGIRVLANIRKDLKNVSRETF